MSRQSSTKGISDRNELERQIQRRWVGLLLFPIALFPLLSLLTYNWRDISWLHAPPLSPPSNLIGIVGAWSVFIGYSLVGLAFWVVPFLVLLFSSMLIYGKILRMGRRAFWMLIFMVALCCLLQLGSATVFDPILERLNLKPNAGGAVGYWLMTCLLARWFSPVGGGILMLSIMLFAGVMAVGIRQLFAVWGSMESWVSIRRERVTEAAELRAQQAEAMRQISGGEAPAPRVRNRMSREEIREAARRAKEEARRAREEERQRAIGEASFVAPAVVAVPSVRTSPLPAPMPAPVVTHPPADTVSKTPPQTAVRSVASVRTESPAALPHYTLPPVSLLNPIPKGTADHGDIEETARVLVETLRQFNVPVEVIGTTPGPVVTQYELRPAPNIKVERIASLTANLQMALEATSLRVLAPIPGKNAVGIEIPNRRARTVTFREIIENEAWRRNTCEVPLLLGKDVAGEDLVFDLTKAPHLLVAGSTGSGKSVCLNAILNGLLMSRTPEQVRLILVDPKRVEFTCYSDLPHLLVPIINDPKKVVFGLQWAIMEMEKRYRLLQKAGCRNIVSYNRRVIATQEVLFDEENPSEAKSEQEELPTRLPYIVIVVDEVANIMAAVGKEVEPAIARLTSLSRAVGIHLILATQRPSVDVITGTIKSNIPGRIAFKVSQANDSRTILDNTGAEELIGKGDFLFLREGSQVMRAQGAWVADEEIARVVAFVKDHCPACYDPALTGRMDKIKERDPEAALEGETSLGEDDSGDSASHDDADDELLPNAIEVIRMTKRASTTMLQRRLRIGYTRAGRLMDILEERGVVGPQVGSATREILIDLDHEIPANSDHIQEAILVSPEDDDAADTDDEMPSGQ